MNMENKVHEEVKALMDHFESRGIDSLNAGEQIRLSIVAAAITAGLLARTLDDVDGGRMAMISGFDRGAKIGGEMIEDDESSIEA